MRKTIRIDGVRHEVVARATGERFHVQAGDRTIEGTRRWDGATLELVLDGDGRRVSVVVVRGAGGRLELWRDSERHVVEEERRGGPGAGRSGNGAGEDALVAPMPAKVVRVSVAAGDAVEEGQTLVVLESMKMELTLHAPRAGRVRRVGGEVVVGNIVPAGTALVEFEPIAGTNAVETA